MHFSVFLIFTIISHPLLTSGDNSLFYCISFDCQEPISFGKTLLVYQAKSDKHLSFQKNEDIKILSKPIGTGDDWVAEYRGKVGLVPHTMVSEQKMSEYNTTYKFPLDDLPLTSDEAPPIDDDISHADSKVDSSHEPLPDPQNVKDEQVQTSQNSNEEVFTPIKDIVVDIDPHGSPSFEILVEPLSKTKEQSNNDAETPVVVQNEEALNPYSLSDSQSTVPLETTDIPSDSKTTTANEEFFFEQPTETETIPEQQSQSVEVESSPESDTISETNFAIDEPHSHVQTPVVVAGISETTVDNVESVESAQVDNIEPDVATEGQDNETPTEQPVVDDSVTPEDVLPVESVTQVPPFDPETPTAETVEQESSIPADEPVIETPETIPVSTEEEFHHQEHLNEDHSYYQDFQDLIGSWTAYLVTLFRHLSDTVMSFLPESLPDFILDVNETQMIYTGIVTLALISLCVPCYFISTFMSTRPLKKQVEELSNSLWKSKTAYEIQLDEFEVYKKKALAHDAKLIRIEQLENQLLVANKLLAKHKEQIKILQKELKVTSKAAANFESVMEGTRKKKDEAIAERDNLLVGIQSLQEALKCSVAEFEDSQAEARLIQEQFERADHEKETFSKLLSKAEQTIEIVKVKTGHEHELRRQAEEMNGQLRSELETVQREMQSVKDICEQYEKTASALSEEVTSKENELLALKETLGEDSPLVDIAEAKARSTTAEEEANALRKRVESMSIEISSLSRNYEETKSAFTTIKEEKEDAENRLQVLETWFKKQEDELRATVEKYETERNIRGKDESELIKIIHDKDDEILQLKEAQEALKQEIEEITTTDKAEIRKLEARIGDNFLQMCQSERKINEARKEAELLRQKLASVARQGDENGAGDLYSDMNPLPPLPDDLPMNMPMPSYFGMDDLLDPLPPLPLGDYPLGRPAPLGRGYPGDDEPPSPIAHGNDYSNFSSRSNSPTEHLRPGSRDDFINENNRSDMPRSRNLRGGPLPNLSSSPIPHGINL